MKGVALDSRTLYEAHVDAVVAFLSRLGVRGADLEDIVHDTFVTALSRRGAYDSSRPVRPWLYGIAFRVMAARNRRFGISNELHQDAPEVSDHESNPERMLQEKQRQVLFQRAVTELSEEQATVLVLHHLQGLAIPQVAESMGTPLATTYSRLRLARENFAAAVRRLNQEEVAP